MAIDSVIKHYFDVLGLKPTTDENAIRKAYYKKLKLLHPDKKGRRGEAAFKMIAHACEALCEHPLRPEDIQDDACGNTGGCAVGELQALIRERDALKEAMKQQATLDTKQVLQIQQQKSQIEALKTETNSLKNIIAKQAAAGRCPCYILRAVSGLQDISAKVEVQVLKLRKTSADFNMRTLKQIRTKSWWFFLDGLLAISVLVACGAAFFWSNSSDHTFSQLSASHDMELHEYYKRSTVHDWDGLQAWGVMERMKQENLVARLNYQFLALNGSTLVVFIAAVSLFFSMCCHLGCLARKTFF